MTKTSSSILAVLAVATLASCTPPQRPHAQVLTTADASIGMNNLGTVTNFPFAGASITTVEDTNRGTVVYIFRDADGRASIGATIVQPPKPVVPTPAVEPLATVQQISPPAPPLVDPIPTSENQPIDPPVIEP